MCIYIYQRWQNNLYVLVPWSTSWFRGFDPSSSSWCQTGVCGCEEGYTEVVMSDGLLDQCTVIPVLEIPTGGDNRADVKTIRAFNPAQPEASSPGRAGRTWFLQPFSPGNPVRDL